MTKPTLVATKYNEATHSYTTTIGTDIGEFTASVVCRPEDYPYESEYFGFELAEIKATIAYARAKRKFYDAQIKVLDEFWGNMSKTRTYDDNAFWVSKIDDKIEELKWSKKFWTDEIDYLKEHYHLLIVDADAFNAAKVRHFGGKL